MDKQKLILDYLEYIGKGTKQEIESIEEQNGSVKVSFK